ncbi:unnamed protein product [Heligmosomoides polygyrus]|uniref:CACTA en-spm transposon protein n=1 Tax=Heligmosomoides polygyrus TaxID=6339 RepID=A0A183F845_HELPZ|nr:unnamed protein product [Heligmosomoides polygyrus]
MEKVIHDFYSDLFNSHVHLAHAIFGTMDVSSPLSFRDPTCHLVEPLDEGQPCERAGFRRGFSTIDHIHTITKLIEVWREYKLPLCLTRKTHELPPRILNVT